MIRRKQYRVRVEQPIIIEQTDGQDHRLRDFVIAEKKKDIRYISQQLLREEPYTRSHPVVQEFIREVLRPATLEEYDNWMRIYLSYGGAPTHYYDFPFSSNHANMFVATCDFESFPLYGSDCLNILIPQNVKWLGGDAGHTSLLFMDPELDAKYVKHIKDVGSSPSRFIPVYANSLIARRDNHKLLRRDVSST